MTIESGTGLPDEGPPINLTETILPDSASPTTALPRVTDNLTQLLAVLPERLRLCLEREGDRDDLLEVVLDLGRPAEARFGGDLVIELLPAEPANRTLTESIEPVAPENEITLEDIAHVETRVSWHPQANAANAARLLPAPDCIEDGQPGPSTRPPSAPSAIDEDPLSDDDWLEGPSRPRRGVSVRFSSSALVRCITSILAQLA